MYVTNAILWASVGVSAGGSEVGSQSGPNISAGVLAGWLQHPVSRRLAARCAQELVPLLLQSLELANVAYDRYRTGYVSVRALEHAD